MGHKGDIHKLTVALPEGKCVVHRIDPETSKSIAALLEAFGIDYTGQSLPAATQTVLFELLKPKREHLSKKERERGIIRGAGWQVRELCQCPRQIGGRPRITSAGSRGRARPDF